MVVALILPTLLFIGSMRSCSILFAAGIEGDDNSFLDAMIFIRAARSLNAISGVWRGEEGSNGCCVVWVVQTFSRYLCGR